MAKSFQQNSEVRPKYCRICYHKSKFVPVKQIFLKKKKTDLSVSLRMCVKATYNLALTLDCHMYE